MVGKSSFSILTILAMWISVITEPSEEQRRAGQMPDTI
jgi:hypothetical protein